MSVEGSVHSLRGCGLCCLLRSSKSPSYDHILEQILLLHPNVLNSLKGSYSSLRGIEFPWFLQHIHHISSLLSALLSTIVSAFIKWRLLHDQSRKASKNNSAIALPFFLSLFERGSRVYRDLLTQNPHIDHHYHVSYQAFINRSSSRNFRPRSAKKRCPSIWSYFPLLLFAWRFW